MQPLVSGVTAALIGIHDLDNQLGFWREELGWNIIEEGAISSVVARELYRVDGEIRVWKLAPVEADSGQLWFMQTPNSEYLVPRHPHTSELGFHAVDLYTRDCMATYDQLLAKGWKWPALPQKYDVPLSGKNIEVMEGFCFGPEGSDIVFVEAKNARSTIVWDKDPTLAYTELTSVVCGVKDVDLAKEFFGPEGLGMSIWYDVTMISKGVNIVAGLPSDSEIRLVFAAGGKTARIEIINVTNHEPTADCRQIQRPGKSLGQIGWSFLTTDLELAMAKVVSKRGRLITRPVLTNDPIHGSARVVAAETPEGAFIELWEQG